VSNIYLINTEDSCPECGSPNYSVAYDSTANETVFTCEHGHWWRVPGKVDRADEATAEYLAAHMDTSSPNEIGT
jgi:hypothetical protein